MLKLAILISNAGTGTNLQAIIDAIEDSLLDATIHVVVSGSDDAYGLKRAKKHRIPTFVLSKDDNLEKVLDKNQHIDYIILAGWKKIIPQSFLKLYKNKILNLHPGLIPPNKQGVAKNPDGTNGLWNRGKLADDAIKNFLDKKATYAGSTVHLLSDEFDFGPILGCCFEKIRKNDTVETLYKRLKKRENALYVETLIRLSKK